MRQEGHEVHKEGILRQNKDEELEAFWNQGHEHGAEDRPMDAAHPADQDHANEPEGPSEVKCSG